jgi:hypothetical protein
MWGCGPVFTVVAVHPSYEIGQDNCAADFSGCTTSTAVRSLADNCGKLYDDTITAVGVCTVPDWWRPFSMNVLVDGPGMTGHYVWIALKVDGEASRPQVVVLYEDGNLRLKPQPPEGRTDTCFGSSVIIGPAAPAPRPYADIQEVRVTPTPLALDITYQAGGTAHIDFIIDRTAAVAVVHTNYDPHQPCVTFRSMYVTDGNADADHVATWRGTFPILEWRALVGRWWFFYRAVRSQHNTSAPDLGVE